MAKKRSAGSLIILAAGIAFALPLAGCVVGKETYQAEVVRANDYEAKAEDLEFRLREKSDNERKMERKLGEAEARAAEADKKVKVAQAATEDVKAALATCGREKDSLGAEIEAAKKALRSGEEQLAQQKSRLKEAEERARDVKAASDAQLARQSGNIEQMRSRVADLTAERDVLTEKLAKLAEEKKVKAEEAPKGYEELLSAMQSEANQGQVTVSQQKGWLTVSLPDEALFTSGSAEIKADGKKLLATLAKALELQADKAIQIEGHTDNVKISGALAEKYPSNWELSTARAVSVVRFLVEKGAIDGKRLSAAGFGEFSPIADNSTKEGRQKNRRIEVKLVPLENKPVEGEKAEGGQTEAQPAPEAQPPAQAQAGQPAPEEKQGESAPAPQPPAEAKPVAPNPEEQKK